MMMLSIISSLPYLISFGWLVCWFYKPHYVSLGNAFHVLAYVLLSCALKIIVYLMFVCLCCSNYASCIVTMHLWYACWFGVAIFAPPHAIMHILNEFEFIQECGLNYTMKLCNIISCVKVTKGLSPFYFTYTSIMFTQIQLLASKHHKVLKIIAI